jgi:hypothetical protein
MVEKLEQMYEGKAKKFTGPMIRTGTGSSIKMTPPLSTG